MVLWIWKALTWKTCSGITVTSSLSPQEGWSCNSVAMSSIVKVECKWKVRPRCIELYIYKSYWSAWDAVSLFMPQNRVLGRAFLHPALWIRLQKLAAPPAFAGSWHWLQLSLVNNEKITCQFLPDVPERMSIFAHSGIVGEPKVRGPRHRRSEDLQHLISVLASD